MSNWRYSTPIVHVDKLRKFVDARPRKRQTGFIMFEGVELWSKEYWILFHKKWRKWHEEVFTDINKRDKYVSNSSSNNGLCARCNRRLNGEMGRPDGEV